MKIIGDKIGSNSLSNLSLFLKVMKIMDDKIHSNSAIKVTDFQIKRKSF